MTELRTTATASKLTRIRRTAVFSVIALVIGLAVTFWVDRYVFQATGRVVTLTSPDNADSVCLEKDLTFSRRHKAGQIDRASLNEAVLRGDVLCTADQTTARIQQVDGHDVQVELLSGEKGGTVAWIDDMFFKPWPFQDFVGPIAGGILGVTVALFVVFVVVPKLSARTY